MRRVLSTLTVVTLMVVGVAMNAHALGTASGTAILNFATMSASGISPFNSNTATTTVQPVYGLGYATGTDTADKTTVAGGFATYSVAVKNRANTSDMVRVNFGTQNFGPGAGTTTNWSAAIDDAAVFTAGLTWTNSTKATASQAGDWVATGPYSPNAFATFSIRVISAANAIDSASMSFTLNFQTTKTPVGGYTGFNGTNYGGAAQVWRQAGTFVGPTYITTKITGAVLTLVKTAVVTAPAGYTGGGSDPVPGARITYTLTYGNSGTAAATLVAVGDQIPANTTYVTGSILLNAVGQTDLVDADECNFNGGSNYVTCIIGTLNGGVVGQTISYEVTIN